MTAWHKAKMIGGDIRVWYFLWLVAGLPAGFCFRDLPELPVHLLEGGFESTSVHLRHRYDGRWQGGCLGFSLKTKLSTLNPKSKH